MGILSAALAAAGDAGVQSINQNIQQQNQLDQMNQQAQLQAQNDASRSNLELQKQQSLLDYQNDLKNEPLDRYAELAKQKSDEQVPIEPAPFTGLNQTSADNSILADGNTPMQSGLQGNVAQINSLEKKAQITLSNPQATDEQKQNAQGILDQLKTQFEVQKQAALDDVQGQTRSRTPDETIDAALTDLKISDPQAYAAAMASGVMPSKYTKVGENETLIDSKGNPVFTNTAGADAQDEKQNRLDARQQNLFEHQIDLQNKRETLKAKNVQDKNDPWKIFTDADGDPVQGLPHGDEFLNMLPSAAQEQVKALSEGRLTLPSGAALRSPSAQNLIAAVAQYDPSFDTINVGSRSATRKDFTSGKAAMSINAINTVMKHLDEYVEAGKALDNSSFKAWNYLGNKTIDATGDPRLTRFRTARNAVVDEVERAYRGSGGSQAGIDAWKENMSENQSPGSIVESGKTLVKLLDGKLEALGDQYTKGMGVAKDGLDLLSPQAKLTYNKLMGNDNNQSTQQNQSGNLPPIKSFFPGL